MEVFIYLQNKERESRKWKAVSFLVFIVCHNKETGNTTQRVFLCMRVCVCRVWASCRHYAKRAFLMAVHSLTFQDDRRINWPVFWSSHYQPKKTCALGQQKWQVQREISYPRGQSMEPLERRTSTHAEGSCGTAQFLQAHPP